MVAVVQSRPDTVHLPGRTVASRRRPTATATATATAPVPVSQRTYRRRRAGAAAIVVSLVVAVQGLLAMAGGGAASERPRPVAAERFSTYVVEPGDTFWSIASRVDPRGDPRPVVDRLVAEHGSAVLQIGDRIALPEGR